MRTIKGALTAAVGLLFLFICLSSWILTAFISGGQAPAPERLDFIRRFGPIGLLGLCVLQLAYSSSEKAVVAFTPPETIFLIAGPFGRRQLLGYKITVNFLSLLVAAVFFLFWFAYLRVPMNLFAARYLGMVLALFFVQLSSMSFGFLAVTIGAAAYNRTRRLLLVGIALILGYGLYRASGGAESDWGTVVDRLEQTPVLDTLLEPLRCFSRALAAESFWPDFVWWGGCSLAIDLGLLALVFLLDAWQIEAATAAGERIYAQVQRVRMGGAAAAVIGKTAKRRFRVPSLPWLGGAGPIAWRQLTAVPRSRSALVVLFLLIPLLFIPMTRTHSDNSAGPAMPVMLAIQVFTITFFLTPVFAFDFRSDIERFELLKTLPIPSWALATGELLTPVLLLTLVQWLDLAVVAIALKRSEMFRALWVAAPLSLPFNFFLVGVDNLLFLLFPTRMVATIGDFQVFGRQLVLQMVKMVILLITGGITAAFAAMAYFLSGRSVVAAVTTGLFVLAGLGAGLVPFIAAAFRKFDVTRDMPI
jgi:hypothetical protein